MKFFLCPFSLQSRLARAGVIIVATFRDRIPSAEVEKKVHQFHTNVNQIYRDREDNVGQYPKEDEQKIVPYLCGVVFITRRMHKQDVFELRSMVYTSALRLFKVVHTAKFVVGQLVRDLLLNLYMLRLMFFQLFLWVVEVFLLLNHSKEILCFIQKCCNLTFFFFFFFWVGVGLFLVFFFFFFGYWLTIDRGRQNL